MSRFIRGMTAIVAGLVVAISARAADAYKIDPAHASVGFTVAHMVINDVSGRFKEFQGTVTLDGGVLTGAKAVIQAKSIDTDVSKRDDHLRSADFFDVEKFPTITFELAKVDKQGDQQVVHGKFTMHGVTKEIDLPVTVKGPIKDMHGDSRIALKAATTINRKDYGLNWNKVLDAGGVLVGEDVHITISAEAVKQAGESK